MLGSSIVMLWFNVSVHLTYERMNMVLCTSESGCERIVRY